MTNVKTPTLKKELEFFNKKRAEFLKHYQGQFVLIKESKLIGTFTTEQEAYLKGVENFGDQSFLIKQVVKEEIPAAHPALTVGLINASL